MPSSAAQEKYALSERVADSVAESIAGVEAVLLFGSVARGDAGPSSDVDLLVVTRERVRRPAFALDLPAEVSPVFHTWTSFAAARREDWSFFVHLRDEGDLLCCRDRRLERELREVAAPTPGRIRAALEADLRLLERYEDPRRFAGSFRFPLGQLFTLAKRTCMEDNTLHGVRAFDRVAAFDAFADRHPEIGDELTLTAALWPFAARIQGRSADLPPGHETEAGLRRASRAVREILRAAIRG